MSHPTVQPGTILDGKYRVEELVGQGGMASVYKGTHIQFDAPVAIKLLFHQFSQDQRTRKRFEREAKLQFQLRHPNLIQVMDIINTPDLLGMVMEWVEGQDLHRYLVRRAEPLSLQEIYRLFLPVLEMVAVAHENGVVHRDLKPANIMLEGAFGEETPKVADFGIAKLLHNDENPLTRTGSIIGTVTYMSPEQAQGSKQLDHRADIYSLGIVLYKMLTATVPFANEEPVAVALAHCNNPVPSLRERNPSVDIRLEKIVLKSLEKRAEDRYSSCIEFAEALQTALDIIASENGEKISKGKNFQPSTLRDSNSSPLPTPASFQKNNDDISFEPTASFTDQPTQHLKEKHPYPSTERTQQLSKKKMSSLLGIGVIVSTLLLMGIFILPSFFSSKRSARDKNSIEKTSHPRRTTLPKQVTTKKSTPIGRNDRTKIKKEQVTSNKRAKSLNKQIKQSKNRAIRKSSNSYKKVYPYRACLRCVQRQYKRIARAVAPGMEAYAGYCNYRDFLSISKACSYLCSRNYSYFCRSYLRQPFRFSRSSFQKMNAALITRCRTYLTRSQRSRLLKRSYPNVTNKLIRSCIKNFNKNP